jgi:hypothetical protein
MKISRSFLATTLLALSVSVGRADCPYSFSCDSAGCTTLKQCATGEPIPWSSADPGRSTFVLAPQGSAPNPAPSTAAPYAVPVPQTLAPPCSETGSCYGDISERTGLPKTTFVHGYLRSDGTYVGSYYRSR